MSYRNIPDELKALPQWICWRFEETDGVKPTKVPYNPRTGFPASVRNPEHWTSFDFALSAVENAALGYSGIGFVLSKNDPYAIIDLDDCEGNAEFVENQEFIYKAFDSYSELSPSRKGLHIVIKAAVGPGRRRNKVELYSQERYMTFTGDQYGPNAVIAERQELAMQLWHEMGKDGGAALYDGNAPQVMDDGEVINRACRAANGEKFYRLHTGQWQSLYQSQSEADFAYVDILAFYTQNREQLHRLFLSSPLGARDKAQRSAYRDYMINKSFDRLLPPINFDTITNAIREHVEAKRAAIEAGAIPAAPKPLDEAHGELTPPPGLLGDIARFIYAAAPRPVPDIAMAGAIAFLAGIVGRAYNVSATGLNQYVLLLANTGTGKEAIASGISRLVGALTDTTPGNPYFVPAAGVFVGPADMASGQGLLRTVSKRQPPSFVSIIGEFGLRFKQMADDRASPADVSLLRTLLDLYNKSGHGQIVGETVYSDKDKNTHAVTAPAVSIIGESVPGSFYDNLNESMVANGLLPRFTIVEYSGQRPRRNPQAQFVKPDPSLMDRLVKVVVASLSANTTNSVVNVTMQPDAEAFLDEFDVFCDDKINETSANVTKELWNRAHIKTLKLAALIAVGCDHIQPTITLEVAQWARTQIERDIKRLLRRFETGEYGVVSRVTDHDRQTGYVLQKILDWTTKDYDSLPKAKPPYHRGMHNSHIVPYQYLARSCLPTAAFKADRDATRALKRSIQNLIDEGTISRVPPAELLPFSFRGEAYVITNASTI